MPLLQEATPERDIKIKCENNEDVIQPQMTTIPYQTFANRSMLTPSQLLLATQMWATTGLGLHPNPAVFFNAGLFAPWSTNSPPSPPTSNEPISPVASPADSVPATTQNNNNNNVVTSSSVERKYKRKAPIKTEAEVPLVSPTSSNSPLEMNIKDGKDKQFTCTVCNRSFGYKHVLQNHERTHTGEKPFECTQCHKRFTRDHHLKTHMRLHTGERPYHCEHCDRQFVQVANLRRHLRVHTGERPYSCDVCQARFSDSNQLKAHVLIHTNEKPFSCEKCQSRFRRRHHLLHHKCGVPTSPSPVPQSWSPYPSTNVSEKDEDVSLQFAKRIMRLQDPIITLPLQVDLPEQTEPEDLSMSTGAQTNASSTGDSPMSRSTDDEYDSEEYYSSRQQS